MTKDQGRTLLLVDGMSMAFRAFFGLPVENFATSTGEPTNAVYGFTAMMASLLKDHEPTHAAVAMDVSSTTFRTERLPSYKGTRDETPPEFKPQIPMIYEVLKALSLPAIGKDNFEADDILATYAKQAADQGFKVLVVSGDRDTFQLVNENVTVLYPRKGVSDLVVMTPAAVEEKYGVPPGKYPDMAALVGETSDNLPGVPGVGPKTAAKWITTYGGLDEIIAQADDIPGKAGESLRAHLDQVRLNRELNELVRDVELAEGVPDLVRRLADAAEIHRVCDALQFRTLRARLLPLAGEAAAGTPAPDAPAATQAEVVTEGALNAIRAIARRCFVYAHGDGADAVALGVADGTGRAWGLDLANLGPADEKTLAGWLADAAVPKVFHGAKDAMHALEARGFDVAGLDGDTEIAAFLVQPDGRGFGIEDVAQRYLGVVSESATGGDELDLGLGAGPAQVAGERAHLVAQLAADLEPTVADRGMGDLYRDLELPLVSVLHAMEATGIAVSDKHLAGLADECGARAEHAKREAFEAIGGDEVNLASPKQLQEVLFERLGMPKTKKTKTGYSTDASSLAELHQKQPHPFLDALLAHRDATKLGQIIETLRKSIHTDGRIHTTFSQTVAATGRLSSRDPNLQNIPIRTEDGHRVREAFVVGEGYETLLTADYSQIEMRIMAHLSEDAALIDAFKAGEDLHNFVGSRVFGVPADTITAGQRSQIKAMSYGLAYGLSSFGLARQLGSSVGEAQALMDDYFARFGGVRDYLRSVVDKARKDGYTETLFGRRRYAPDLNSTNRQRREMAERMALNAPIQGSAADLIKRAMLGVDRELAKQGLKSRQLLQVHDELVLEVAAGERDAVEAIMRNEMENAHELRVPLDVNVGEGNDWRTAGH